MVDEIDVVVRNFTSPQMVLSTVKVGMLSKKRSVWSITYEHITCHLPLCQIYFWIYLCAIKKLTVMNDKSNDNPSAYQEYACSIAIKFSKLWIEELVDGLKGQFSMLHG